MSIELIFRGIAANDAPERVMTNAIIREGIFLNVTVVIEFLLM